MINIGDKVTFEYCNFQVEAEVDAYLEDGWLMVTYLRERILVHSSQVSPL